MELDELTESEELLQTEMAVRKSRWPTMTKPELIAEEAQLRERGAVINAKGEALEELLKKLEPIFDANPGVTTIGEALEIWKQQQAQ